MFKRLTDEMNKTVFITSAVFILLITIVSTIIPKELGLFFSSLQNWLITNTGWVYILTVGTILFFSIWLMLSRFKDIKLGPDHSKPEHSNISWFAMLFSAGMGIGLMFWGVAEPIMHFTSPPVGTSESLNSAREAMKITFFHWGLHAWAIYAILGVILAYFAYRKDLPLLPRSLFYPFFEKKIFGPLGDAVDIFAIIGTMFGVAASLGLGVTQVNAGLNYLFDLPQTVTIQIILIAIITCFATISVVLGLDGGIKKLSNINVALALLLMVGILIFGDTVYLMKSFVQNTGSYLSDIIHKTFNLYTYEKKDDWIGGWTLLYWAWWIAWAPFVGMFIARISRGRTIKEFMIGVLFVPTGFTFLWMTIFGGSGINLILNKGQNALSTAVSENVSTALFKFFEFFPMSNVLSLLGVLLIITFFVSSSDSGSLVIDTLASGGKEEPPVWQRIFWALTEGVVAATLLYAGGLEALQTMTIVSAFPIILLIIIGGWGFVKTLQKDFLHQQIVQNHQTITQYDSSDSDWKKRIDSLLATPKEKQAKVFLIEKVNSALQKLQKEFQKKGLSVVIESNEISCSMQVGEHEQDRFLYQVKIRDFETPHFLPDDADTYRRAEVFLISGGQEYDIFGYTEDQVIADVLTQYEKHVHFLHHFNI